MNWILLPLSPHPHVILHAGLARSCRIHCFKKRRKTFSLGRRCPSGRIRGGGKCSSPALTHRLLRSPLSRRARVIFGWWILRLRLQLRAEWQGGRHAAKSESFQINGSDFNHVQWEIFTFYRKCPERMCFWDAFQVRISRRYISFDFCIIYGASNVYGTKTSQSWKGWKWKYTI